MAHPYMHTHMFMLHLGFQVNSKKKYLKVFGLALRKGGSELIVEKK